MVLTASSKHDAAVALVADRLLAVPVGERIPTVTELGLDAKAGSGTIQAALRSLREAGAVELSAHGHRGTELVRRDLAALWAATNRGPLNGVIPLPSSLEFSGLATALAEAFEQNGLPLNLSFRQGSRHRFAALERGSVDFAVASAAASAALAPDDAPTVRLVAHSFFARDSVAVITRAGEDPDPRGRVLVDPGSRDHTELTQGEFPDAELIECSYLVIPELVVRGEADAAVWHRTSTSPLLVATGIAIHPLSRPAVVDPDISRAALVARPSDPAVATVLDTVIEVEALDSVQRDVLELRRPPSF